MCDVECKVSLPPSMKQINGVFMFTNTDWTLLRHGTSYLCLVVI